MMFLSLIVFFLKDFQGPEEKKLFGMAQNVRDTEHHFVSQKRARFACLESLGFN